MADAFVPVEQDRQGTARYLAAFREHWLLIAILVVVAVGTAAAYSATATKRYEASTDLLVTPIPANDPTYVGIDVLRESTDPQARSVLTVAQLIRTPEVAGEVEDRIGGSALLDHLQVRPVSQSNVLTLVGEANDPRRAAAIANTFAEVTIEQRTEQFQESLTAVISRLERRQGAVEFGSIEAEELERRLATLRSLVGTTEPTLEITSRAVPPGGAVWPRPKLSIAVALLAALLLGSGIALGLELLTPRVKREDELLLDHRLPILARVPRLPASVARGYLTRHEPLPAEVWESYRTLRASLVAAGEEGGIPRTILVTSAMPGEGKTMTAVNLSVTMALAGMKVILVDGDLRRPMVAPVFGVAATREGFASLLLGKGEAHLVPAPGHGERLRLLLASPEHAQLIDLLEPRRVKRALDDLRDQADVVIVDSPPLTEVADALPLADEVDAVIVAVRLGYTRRDRLSDLRRMLAQHGVSPMGFVVTTLRAPRGRGYYAYRGTGEARTATEGASAEATEATAATRDEGAPAAAPAAAPDDRQTRTRGRDTADRRARELEKREREVAKHRAQLAEDRRQIETMRAEVERARKRIGDERKELERTEKARARTAHELQAREAAAKSEHERAEATTRELEAERQQLQTLRAELLGAREEHGQVARDLAQRASAVEAERVRLAAREHELNAEREQLESTRTELARAAKAQTEADSDRERLAQRERELAAEQERLQAERAQLAAAEQQRAEAEAERQRLEQVQAELAEAERRQAVEARALADERAELDRLRKETLVAAGTKDELGAERQRLEELRGTLAAAEKQRQVDVRALEDERRRLERMQAEIARVAETQATRQRELETGRQRVEAARAELAAVEKAKAELEDERTTVEKLRAELKGAADAQASRHRELDTERQRLEAGRAELAAVETAKAELDDERGRVETLRTEVTRAAEAQAARHRELEAEAQRLEGLRAEVAGVDKARSELDAEGRRLEQLRAELGEGEKQRARDAKALEDERRRLETLRADLDRADQMRTHQDRESKAERERIEALRKELADAERGREESDKQLGSRTAAIEERERRVAELEGRLRERADDVERRRQELETAEPNAADLAPPAEDRAAPEQRREPAEPARTPPARRSASTGGRRGRRRAQPEPARADRGQPARLEVVAATGAPPPETAAPAPAAFDTSLTFNFLGVSEPEAAESFGRDLASYIEQLYGEELSMQNVAVERRRATTNGAGLDVTLTFRLAAGGSEENAERFARDLAAYIESLYEEQVKVERLTVEAPGQDAGHVGAR